ncbi:MAG: tetratricopeptide repeat protein, partial [Candidatus Eisenbacteria bacterium]|nr:tetratricopeptide repeat protein [Candidatus Eisenbacteria bacterium]
MGRPQKVLETVFRYLEAHPTRHRWAQDMIESLSRRGELGDEEITLLETYAREAENPAVLRLVADALVFAGHPDRAAGWLLEADQKSDARGRLLLPLADILLHRGAPEVALAVVDTVLQLSPPKALAEEARFQRAQLLVELQRWEEAVTAYEDLAERHPQGRMAHRALMEEAQILRRQLGSPERARDVYGRLEQLLDRGGSDPVTARLMDQARLGMAECDLYEGNWAEAESTLTRLAEASSTRETREQAAYLIAEARLFHGDYPGAEAGYFAVVDSFPGGTWVNDALQRVLFLQEHAFAGAGELGGVVQVLLERWRARPDSALALAESLLARDPGLELQDDLLYQTVLCRVELEDYEAAAGTVRSWPDTLADSRLAPRALAAVAEALSREPAHVETAMELFEELLLRYPESYESRRARPRLTELRRSGSS